MNFSVNSLTAMTFSGSETILIPYNVEYINESIFYLSPSATTKTTEMLEKHLLTNITESGVIGQLPTVERRGYSDHLSESSLQLVSKQVAEKVSFVFVMILIPFFSMFGSVGNVLSLRVLVHHRMRNTTNMVLAALSVSDLLFLLHALYFSCLTLYAFTNPEAGKQARSMTFPVLGPYGSVVTARITTGLTTMLSIERFVAVYFPMKAKVMCDKVMTLTCIMVIYLVTALLFIPNALKYQSSSRMTIDNQTTYTTDRTELGKNDLFYLIYGNIVNILFRFIPILILIVVNILIALAIRRTWSFRRTMSNGASASYEQNRITLMLLMVSMVFLVCILPGAIHSIMDQVYKQYSSSGYQSNMYDIIRNVTYFLETVNSSVNFVIYMAFSTKFCQTYKKIFCCSNHGHLPRSSTRSIIRVSFQAQHGPRTSMTSYRELYFLNQLGNGKLSTMNVRELNEKPVCKNGMEANLCGVTEGGGKRVYRSKYSISESYSSQSHSGHSSQGKGERCNEHSVSSINSAHSNHSLELTAAEMYS